MPLIEVIKTGFRAQEPHIVQVVLCEAVDGVYPSVDGTNSIGVTFDYSYWPARVVLDCVNAPDFQGTKRKTNRIVQVGYRGTAEQYIRRNVADEEYIRVDMETHLQPDIEKLEHFEGKSAEDIQEHFEHQKFLREAMAANQRLY